MPKPCQPASKQPCVHPRPHSSPPPPPLLPPPPPPARRGQAQRRHVGPAAPLPHGQVHGGAAGRLLAHRCGVGVCARACGCVARSGPLPRVLQHHPSQRLPTSGGFACRLMQMAFTISFKCMKRKGTVGTLCPSFPIQQPYKATPSPWAVLSKPLVPPHACCALSCHLCHTCHPCRPELGFPHVRLAGGWVGGRVRGLAPLAFARMCGVCMCL